MAWPRTGKQAQSGTSNAPAPNATGRNHQSSASDGPKTRSSTRAGASASEEFAKIWQQLLHEPVDSEDEWKVRLALLEDWADHDLRAALGAALGFRALHPHVPIGQHSLLSAFDTVIQRHPLEFIDLLKDDPFGLESGRARRHALNTIARSDPGFIPTILDRLGRSDRITAMSLCLGNPKFDAVRRDELIRSIGSLPDDPANREMFRTMGSQLATLDRQELLDRYAAARSDGEKRVLTSAMHSKLLNGRSTREDFAKQLESLPPALSSAVLTQTLDQPMANAGAFTLALDHALDQPEWADREKELCMRLHQIQLQSDTRQLDDLTHWASGLPEREDCEDLYRVAMRASIYKDPDNAWQTIQSMPSGWKRDNAFLEMVNRAAHTQGDEAAALRALDQIESEHFREQATQMIETARAKSAGK